MEIRKMEIIVLENLQSAFNEAESTDTVNKLYRQARIWVRFHHIFAQACTVDDATYLKARIKEMRKRRLNELTIGGTIYGN